MYKKSPITSFNKIGTYLRKKMGRLALELEYQSLLNISLPDQIELNASNSSLGDARIVPFGLNQFSLEEKAIDDFFSNINSSQVEEELFKWFFFGLTGKGQHIIDLASEELTQFANSLPRLIVVIYNYRQSLKKEANNGA